MWHCEEMILVSELREREREREKETKGQHKNYEAG